MVFGAYADLYDSFYSEKNYNEEIDYIQQLVKIYSPIEVRSILDLGCGTGNHLIPFCKKGYIVDGIDLSPQMIEKAVNKIRKEGLQQKGSVEIGNVVTYKNGKQYDLVISMFAVMGYLTDNESIIGALKTVKLHLRHGGLFIFDVWFGPTVINNLPETRIQEFSSDDARIIRMVRPEMNIIDQNVLVNYDIFTIGADNKINEIRESHTMRYFFLQEIKMFMDVAGLKMVAAHPFLNYERQPRLGDWNVTIVAQLL